MEVFQCIISNIRVVHAMDSASDEDTTISGGMYVEMDEDTHEQYEENFADFMTDIQNHVKQLAAESSRAPQDAYEAFQGMICLCII